MDKERVKFYSRSDYFYSYMLNKALEKIRIFDINKETYSLEEILELYNITKYIDDDVQPFLKNEEDKPFFDVKRKKALMKPIGIFFNKLNDSNILALSVDSIHGYSEDYLELFEKFEVYKKISAENFFSSLTLLHIPDYNIYHHKKVVQHYNTQLRLKLLESEDSFSLLLKKYLSTENKKEIFLPKSLSKEDKEQITINYINSKCAHINTLEVIISLPTFEDFIISDDTRILAKDKYDEQVKELFDSKKGVGLKTELRVGFTEAIEEAFKCTYDSNQLSLNINPNWIKENLDFPTLLNNLIYVFGLTDMQMRISNISKPNNMHTVTRAFTDRKLKNFYLHGQEFELLNSFSFMGTIAYRDYLKSAHNIRLEDVIQWFFDKYLPEEFSINDFSVNMPSANSTYLEKCRMICCEFESLLKQYDSLVKYGKIRHDIIEISSRPIIIENVRSFIPHKYIYPNKDTSNTVMYWLFSDQTMLTYFEKKKDRQKHNNLFKLLLHEKININEYQEYQKNSLRYLLNEKIISIDDKGYISFVNLGKAYILYDLYYNEFASYSFYKNKGLESSINELIQKEWIYIGSSLLSIPECSYINFHLNKQEYFNGFDLRNTYLHGTQRKKGKDTELHKQNYNKLLTLYLLVVIKINDDLSQKEELLTNKEKEKIK